MFELEFFSSTAQSRLIENEKKISKNMQATLKLLDIARNRRKTLKKKKKNKNKKSDNNNEYFDTFPFYIEKDIFC